MEWVSEKSLKRVRKIIGAMGIVLVIIVVVIIAVNFMNERVIIKDSGVVKEVPSKEIQDIKEVLHQVMEEDVGMSKNEKIEVKARDYRSFSNQNQDGTEIKTARFLVDNEKYGRSYLVVINWAVGKTNYAGITTGPMITCPILEETKYPEAKCRAMNGSSYSDYKEEDGK